MNAKQHHVSCCIICGASWQVLRNQEEGRISRSVAWCELVADALPEGSRPSTSLPLQLPIWTDLVTHVPQPPPVAIESLTLPRSIRWQRMPEAMVVKQIRLQFNGPSAAEIKQGMVCELEVQVDHQAEQQSHAVEGVKHPQQSFSQRVSPGDWVLDAGNNVLTADLQLAVHYLEDIGISTVGLECGPGDAVYLATWGTGNAVLEHDSESLFLSYGNVEADACMVQLSLVPTKGTLSACCTVCLAQCHNLYCIAHK